MRQVMYHLGEVVAVVEEQLVAMLEASLWTPR
jgi:hypothetical protein